ncbi:shikimate dehydrogenase [endosymbiont of Lamellibrachia barhami]|uniref:shikimate dehydrogenase n=1 Tax=endosymbiont of Lamellibrachia barhami TaxID=205975 RepID=UPI0034E23A97
MRHKPGSPSEYTRLLGSLDDFEGDVTRFSQDGGQGLNITVPFQRAAWRLADELSKRAHTAGGQYPDRLEAASGGDNTIGIGLVRDLTINHGFRFKGKRVLILGAGGAVRGVVHPLLEEQPKRLIIANRTAAKAYSLATVLSGFGPVAGCGLDELEGMQFDLIINGTAAGLGGEVPKIPEGVLTKGSWCYDMMYGDEPTAFQKWARERHAARALDGLGMLVEQAAESFRLWRDILPDTVPVIQMLRG